MADFVGLSVDYEGNLGDNSEYYVYASEYCNVYYISF